MPVTRGTTNTNVRGSAADRRARRAWILAEFGDGTTAPCHIALEGCEGTVDIVTLWVDRFPIPGCEGGTYRRDNIRPACAPCQMASGAYLAHARRTIEGA